MPNQYQNNGVVGSGETPTVDSAALQQAIAVAAGQNTNGITGGQTQAILDTPLAVTGGTETGLQQFAAGLPNQGVLQGGANFLNVGTSTPAGTAPNGAPLYILSNGQISTSPQSSLTGGVDSTNLATGGSGGQSNSTATGGNASASIVNPSGGQSGSTFGGLKLPPISLTPQNPLSPPGFTNQSQPGFTQSPVIQAGQPSTAQPVRPIQSQPLAPSQNGPAQPGSQQQPIQGGITQQGSPGGAPNRAQQLMQAAGLPFNLPPTGQIPVPQGFGNPNLLASRGATASKDGAFPPLPAVGQPIPQDPPEITGKPVPGSNPGMFGGVQLPPEVTGKPVAGSPRPLVGGVQKKAPAKPSSKEEQLGTAVEQKSKEISSSPEAMRKQAEKMRDLADKLEKAAGKTKSGAEGAGEAVKHAFDAIGGAFNDFNKGLGNYAPHFDPLRDFKDAGLVSDNNKTPPVAEGIKKALTPQAPKIAPRPSPSQLLQRAAGGPPISRPTQSSGLVPPPPPQAAPGIQYWNPATQSLGATPPSSNPIPSPTNPIGPAGLGGMGNGSQFPLFAPQIPGQTPGQPQPPQAPNPASGQPFGVPSPVPLPPIPPNPQPNAGGFLPPQPGVMAPTGQPGANPQPPPGQPQFPGFPSPQGPPLANPQQPQASPSPGGQALAAAAPTINPQLYGNAQDDINDTVQKLNTDKAVAHADPQGPYMQAQILRARAQQTFQQVQGMQQQAQALQHITPEIANAATQYGMQQVQQHGGAKMALLHAFGGFPVQTNQQIFDNARNSYLTGIMGNRQAQASQLNEQAKQLNDVYGRQLDDADKANGRSIDQDKELDQQANDYNQAKLNNRRDTSTHQIATGQLGLQALTQQQNQQNRITELNQAADKLTYERQKAQFEMEALRANGNLHEAHARQIDIDNYYAAENNLRNWIHTIGGAAGAVTKGVGMFMSE